MRLARTFKDAAVKWVWNHSPTCAEMARLTSRSLEQPLSTKTRLQMWLHHLICVWCQRYGKQLRAIHDTAPQLDRNLGVVSRETLSPEAKREMVRALRAAQGR